ncbi:hypothetical protein DLM78_04270 [Leptospira stimsonii]|uniref:Uncharacterized protein n=1 Tax=Leptospira stimsonii TaxID=2202203 RepID=A0A8B3CVA3_9LEPT|nr:hypothetical protein DLM78_04270 [Leptospira stimsonii]
MYKTYFAYPAKADRRVKVKLQENELLVSNFLDFSHRRIRINRCEPTSLLRLTDFSKTWNLNFKKLSNQ